MRKKIEIFRRYRRPAEFSVPRSRPVSYFWLRRRRRRRRRPTDVVGTRPKSRASSILVIAENIFNPNCWIQIFFTLFSIHGVLQLLQKKLPWIFFCLARKSRLCKIWNGFLSISGNVLTGFFRCCKNAKKIIALIFLQHQLCFNFKNKTKDTLWWFFRDLF